ncbi:hypothetical protein CRUP_024657, partial [Coryphaenoides rupestris]
MSDDISAVKDVTASLVDSKVGTRDEPSLYVLVPFNDPDFGPLRRTTDPEVFKTWLNALTATGGGDFPELSLSGLQLALTGAPPGSEIFMFTDATAKDSHLKDTVIALIERTKTVVNFMLTGSFVFTFRSRRDVDGQSGGGPASRMSTPESHLYSDLAQSSGGQAIQVSKSELSEATSIITESSAASLVTLLQAVRSPGKDETFSFSVDESSEFDGSILEPGSSISVPFTVTINGTGGQFSIQATNDQGLLSTFPALLVLADDGSANGTVTLTAPPSTPTGTAVTLTIQAQSPGATDTNYVVLRMSIVAVVTDNSRPVCQVMTLTANCTSNCSESTWEVTANLTDTNSTGIERIFLQQGNGTLNNQRGAGTRRGERDPCDSPPHHDDHHHYHGSHHHHGSHHQ